MEGGAMTVESGGSGGGRHRPLRDRPAVKEE